MKTLTSKNEVMLFNFIISLYLSTRGRGGRIAVCDAFSNHVIYERRSAGKVKTTSSLSSIWYASEYLCNPVSRKGRHRGFEDMVRGRTSLASSAVDPFTKPRGEFYIHDHVNDAVVEYEAPLISVDDTVADLSFRENNGESITSGQILHGGMDASENAIKTRTRSASFWNWLRRQRRRVRRAENDADLVDASMRTSGLMRPLQAEMEKTVPSKFSDESFSTTALPTEFTNQQQRVLLRSRKFFWIKFLTNFSRAYSKVGKSVNFFYTSERASSDDTQTTVAISNVTFTSPSEDIIMSPEGELVMSAKTDDIEVISPEGELLLSAVTDDLEIIQLSESGNITLLETTADNHASNSELVSILLFRRMLGTIIQSLLQYKLSKRFTNLQISANPSPNVFSRLVSRGEVGSDLQIQFDEISLPNIKISGGGRIDINNLSVQLFAFLLPRGTLFGQFVRKRVGGMKRFTSRFEFHAIDCTLTQGDILSSSCIRNGLQNLLSMILRRVGFLGVPEVIVESVNLLPSEKISCTGEALTKWGIRVPFEVRSGLATTGEGRVLTFPGLEIAWGTGQVLGVFVPVLPEIDLDIGRDAKVETIVISGEKRCVTVSARATVTPGDILLGAAGKRRIRKDSLARYACDAGRFITRIGNFNN